MSFQESALEEIKNRWREILEAEGIQPATKGYGEKGQYVCPICGHGKGGDGLKLWERAELNGTLHCFTCNFTGDVIKLLQDWKHMDFTSAVKEAAELLSIPNKQLYIPIRPESPHTSPQRRKSNPDVKLYSENKNAVQGKYGAIRGMDKETNKLEKILEFISPFTSVERDDKTQNFLEQTNAHYTGETLHNHEGMEKSLEEVCRKTALYTSVKGLTDEPTAQKAAEAYRNLYFDAWEKDAKRLITERSQWENVTTGIKSLDSVIYHINPGLNVIAGQSGMGKTTFCLNIADNLARKGHFVIYISLEMDKLTLISKSLSRIYAENITPTKEFDKDNRKYFTAGEISEGKAAKNPDFIRAVEEYRQTIGQNLLIYESDTREIDNILDTIRLLTAFRNIDKPKSDLQYEKPIIFIDYLQILSDSQAKDDRRQEIDSVLYKLTAFAREAGAAIYLISALNRGSYGDKANFAALKESGLIEYSAETVTMLNFTAIENGAKKPTAGKDGKTIADTTAEEMAKNPREITAKILKNRHGKANANANLLYYPQFDFVTDAPQSHKRDSKTIHIYG